MLRRDTCSNRIGNSAVAAVAARSSARAASHDRLVTRVRSIGRPPVVSRITKSRESSSTIPSSSPLAAPSNSSQTPLLSCSRKKNRASQHGNVAIQRGFIARGASHAPSFTTFVDILRSIILRRPEHTASGCCRSFPALLKRAESRRRRGERCERSQRSRQDRRHFPNQAVGDSPTLLPLLPRTSVFAFITRTTSTHRSIFLIPFR